MLIQVCLVLHFWHRCNFTWVMVSPSLHRRLLWYKVHTSTLRRTKTYSDVHTRSGTIIGTEFRMGFIRNSIRCDATRPAPLYPIPFSARFDPATPKEWVCRVAFISTPIFFKSSHTWKWLWDCARLCFNLSTTLYKTTKTPSRRDVIGEIRS